MITDTDTVRLLAEMNDVAAFERVATAVLRAENAQLYANLSHPGVQPGGKTVRAPFDNVGWVQSADGARFVCAAHTTEQKDLRGKWLHDPATVKPRKAGGKPTKPAGDLIKGIAEIQKLRETHPQLAVSLALTTNRETSLELRVAVEAMAHSAGIDLHIWPVSRIAHFLDTDPTGQIIRKNTLGIAVRLMSRDLLLELGRRSIQDHLQLAATKDNILRDGFTLDRSDTLVIGASGMGKTTACAIELNSFIKKGQPAIILKTEYLTTATTMEAAIESELRRTEPDLESGAGKKALLLCIGEDPLMVLVEDINRAVNPGPLLNKVLSWIRTSAKANDDERLWRVVCPIWPQYLDSIEDQKRVLAAMTLLRVDRYTSAEAIRAVHKRAGILGIQMDEDRAVLISVQLGRDPLLIGLHDLNSEETASGVIQTYVEERLNIVATHIHSLKSEVIQAMSELLRKMLQHRNLRPQWTEVKSWIADQDMIELLRHIAREGNVMRIPSARVEETLEFRHDRVLHHLLSGALAEVFKLDMLPDYATDPFYAEVAARAAVWTELPLQQLERWMDESPETAAYALQISSEFGSSYTTIAAQALSQWLQREDVKGDSWVSQRYAVAQVLAETTAPDIRYLITQFPSSDYPWHPLFSAAFRNGDLIAGLRLLSLREIGVTVAGKQNLLAFVKRLYSNKLSAAVDATLQRTDLNHLLNSGMRAGALRLAGYIGDSSLAQAVRICWNQDDDRGSRLRSYLFAAARCCGSTPDAILGPVCDAWEALPEDPDSDVGQPAERLAAEYVAWEFRSYPIGNAVGYFVERANTSKKLEWPITYMLRTVDHPDALEQVARYAAKAGFMSASSLKSDWEPHSRNSGRRMSLDSKNRLLRIFSDETESDNVRKQMFDFWALAADVADLDILRQIPEGSLLHERSLWARARRKDRSVIPQVLRKFPENPEHWLHIASYQWSNTLTEALDPILDQVAEEQEEYSNLEYAVAKALEHVKPKQVVSMLRQRWARLMTKPLMVQTALLSTEHDATILVHEAFTSSQNPRALLKHFVSHATISSNGNFGLVAPTQLHNLIPYLDLFPEDEIELLWETCTNKGWLDFRIKHLESRMRNISNRHMSLPSDPVNTEDLDLALSGTIVYLSIWFDQQVQRGLGRQKVFAAILDWLSHHDEQKAIKIVGEIVSQVATRREFQMFETTLGQRCSTVPNMRAIRFNVHRRSLV